MTYSLPDPLLPFLLVLALCIVLALGLSVAALRRVNSTRRGWRLGAGWLAVAGLWLLAFPPSQRLRTSTSEAIVLTPGYSPDTLRQLLRQLGPGTVLWRYAMPAAAADTPTLSHVAALRQRLPGLRQVHVLGQGLPAADLPELGVIRLVAHPAAPQAGFRSASWARSAQVGQPWAVEGYVANSGAEGPVWVRLRAAGGLRDSVQLPAGRGAFRLQFVPKTAGRTVYALDARTTDGSGLRLPIEPLPLEVLPVRPLRVLLLAAAPSFELRFLKDYLGRQGHQVALRTGLSKGLTQTEFLNQSARDVSRLTSSLLNQTDIVLADAASLSALSAAEASAVSGAVRYGQSGLLLLAETAVPLPRSLPARSAFVLELQSAKVAQEPQVVQWPTASAKTLVPATLRPGAALRPLISTQRQQPVAAARRLGLGQVVVSTIIETFPWVLQGQTKIYASYWSQLLSAAAPPIAPRATLAPETQWPRPNAPLTLKATGLSAAPITITAAATPTRVALRQDTRVPEWATGIYWPTRAGWHQATGQGVSSWFYVFSEQQWQGPETALRRQAAASWVAQSGTRLSSGAHLGTTSRPWSRWWGFGLFLLGAGLLWLEEKL